ncbi:MAG: response regulator transcription factor [Ruminococcaceae bacterium]|nr:response regulator transcription factor [Oscillospiraceae bacterium]
MFDILVVEDDRSTRLLMETVLRQGGYNPIPASNGLEALEIMDHKHIDLVLLDVMMPGMDGYEFAKTLREGGSSLPILMVTAKESPADKKLGFLSGTDDYMVKPVDEEEMLLRIAALLRRSRISAEHKINVGGTVLDYDRLTVSCMGTETALPPKEFMLLYKLLSYQGKIFTRAAIMDEIWDLDSESDPHTVDVHINRLREKFGENPDFEIVTVRGLGYKAVRRL